jgi:hypothetical protein
MTGHGTAAKAVPPQETRMSKHIENHQRAAGMVTGFAVAVTALSALILIYVSYLFEREAFTALLGAFGQATLFPRYDFTVADGLAVGLNGAKIALPFIVAQKTALEGSMAIGPRAMRGLVLVLSLFMTLVIVSGATISPNAQKRFDALQADAGGIHVANVAALADDLDKQIKLIEARFVAESGPIAEASAARLADLNAQLDVERGIGGSQFRGPHYKEIERLIEAERSLSATRLDDLRKAELAAIDAVNSDGDKKRAVLDATLAKSLADLDFSKIYASPEAQEPHVMSLVHIGQQFFQPEVVGPVTVTIALAVLISFLIEMTPMTLLRYVFNAFTVTALPRVEPEPKAGRVGPQMEPDGRHMVRDGVPRVDENARRSEPSIVSRRDAA